MTGKDGGLIRARKLTLKRTSPRSRLPRSSTSVTSARSWPWTSGIIDTLTRDDFIPVIAPIGGGGVRRVLQYQRGSRRRQAGPGTDGRKAHPADQPARHTGRPRRTSDRPLGRRSRRAHRRRHHQRRHAAEDGLRARGIARRRRERADHRRHHRPFAAHRDVHRRRHRHQDHAGTRAHGRCRRWRQASATTGARRSSKRSR